jgi:ApaG protein
MPSPRPQPKTHGSVTLTKGFRVSVAPSYLPDHSEPQNGKFVFGYRVTIRNESERPAKLLSRRWVINDAHARQREVIGEGVVGLQPVIQPGEAHSYSSFCPLPTVWGTMEGSYTMQSDNGSRFDIEIGRFYLLSPDALDTPPEEPKEDSEDPPEKA